MGIGGQEIDEGGHEGGFAAAAFADNADHLAAMGFKIGGAQGLDLADAGIIADGKVFHAEQGFTHRRPRT